MKLSPYIVATVASFWLVSSGCDIIGQKSENIDKTQIPWNSNYWRARLSLLRKEIPDKVEELTPAKALKAHEDFFISVVRPLEEKRAREKEQEAIK